MINVNIEEESRLILLNESTKYRSSPFEVKKAQQQTWDQSQKDSREAARRSIGESQALILYITNIEFWLMTNKRLNKGQL